MSIFDTLPESLRGRFVSAIRCRAEQGANIGPSIPRHLPSVGAA